MGRGAEGAEEGGVLVCGVVRRAEGGRRREVRRRQNQVAISSEGGEGEGWLGARTRSTTTFHASIPFNAIPLNTTPTFS